MKNQIIERFILAFMVITTFSSTAQEKEVKDIPGPDKVTFPNFAPKGIFAIVPWDLAPDNKTWKAPCIDGVTIRRYWKDLNPAPGKYEWRELDRMFTLADSFSKRIHLMIAPGFYSPDWVLQKVETARFIAPQGPKEYKGKMLPLPLPWNPTYLNLWLTFVDTLAKRYAPNSALSLVAVTGPNSHNGEVNLPSDKSDWDILKEEKYKGYDPVPQWKKIVGGGPQAEQKLKERMAEAYRKTIDSFHKAFAGKQQKYFSMQIFEDSLPVDDKAIHDNYENELITYARGKPGNYFVLLNGGLRGWPVYPRQEDPPPVYEQWVRIQRLAADGLIAGFQTQHPSNLVPAGDTRDTPLGRQIYRQVIKNAIIFGASFLELYDDDIHHKNLEDLVAAGSVLLNGKCNCP